MTRINSEKPENFYHEVHEVKNDILIFFGFFVLFVVKTFWLRFVRVRCIRIYHSLYQAFSVSKVFLQFRQ